MYSSLNDEENPLETKKYVPVGLQAWLSRFYNFSNGTALKGRFVLTMDKLVAFFTTDSTEALIIGAILEPAPKHT